MPFKTKKSRLVTALKKRSENMIRIINNTFVLLTEQTSYIFSANPNGLLLHHYYGPRIPFIDVRPFEKKLHGGAGTSCLYEGQENQWIDLLDLEASFVGKGDFREPMISISHPKLGYTNNFKYQGYELIKEPIEDLPTSYDSNQTLRIDLYDDLYAIKMELYYKVFEKANVITKYVKVINESKDTLTIHKIMSHQIDMQASNLSLLSFDGAWAKERHRHSQPLTQGIYVMDSKSGVSSNKHNPFFIVKGESTSEFHGDAYGFNLVYSGNYTSIIEVTPQQNMRILQGINPYCFEWTLKTKKAFTTPEAVLTFTNQGLNSLSQNMHYFVNQHIVRGLWKNRVRPILINNWEATYFNFNEKKLIKIAQGAKDLGVELFVLDDGWFGNRNNDQTSLGDWYVNTKKLPKGLSTLSKKIKKMGLMFGLWVEPEMINEQSELYKAHPEYAVRVPGRTPSTGRNQLLLDLTNKKVRQYLIDQLSFIFKNAQVDYVKWDFNRNMTDMYGTTLKNQGEFFHKYTLGLYAILKELTKAFPHVLFESCASGGNRFDLGMLCYMPQVWTSDNTDYLERIYIQTGTSYGYPLSTMGAHVSDVPNHQTLRTTPLESRFNISCFGLLGYELDVKRLTLSESEKVRNHIRWYKKNRKTLQYGTFYRSDPTCFDANSSYFYCINNQKEKAIVGFYQALLHPSLPEDIIKIKGLVDNKKYIFTNIKQPINLSIFGGLINLVLPIQITLNGKIHRIICRLYHPKPEDDTYIVYGKTLNYAGVRLHQQFMGTGFNDKVRVLGDFGSRLYVINHFNMKKYRLKRKQLSRG